VKVREHPPFADLVYPDDGRSERKPGRDAAE